MTIIEINQFVSDLVAEFGTHLSRNDLWDLIGGAGITDPDDIECIISDYMEIQFNAAQG